MGCRPRLRNHGVGWVGCVERLRNGGVPRDPVFLMPARDCNYVREEGVDRERKEGETATSER